ncbi:hypothetical protein BD289DRAFT_428824 [Coniella lustricola]|uniref:Uncharacterized protein n=1 Tax=Coniella lustricola TaxID=2025994 RepID=A0A2T3ADP6_9PEZI|nr:hypothetical protein BD289DRAFT_428824 [Coniella lustricola]
MRSSVDSMQAYQSGHVCASAVDGLNIDGNCLEEPRHHVTTVAHIRVPPVELGSIILDVTSIVSLSIGRNLGNANHREFLRTLLNLRRRVFLLLVDGVVLRRVLSVSWSFSWIRRVRGVHFVVRNVWVKGLFPELFALHFVQDAVDPISDSEL